MPTKVGKSGEGADGAMAQISQDRIDALKVAPNLREQPGGQTDLEFGDPAGPATVDLEESPV